MTPVSASSPAAWRSSWSKRLQVAAISHLAYPLMRAWGATYRYSIEGDPQIEQALAMGSPIPAFWHGRIVASLIRFRGRGISIMISESFDGEWIARVASRFGYRVVRGSNSRAARRGTLQMVRDVREHPMAFALDGPRGPARVAKPGAAWLSKATSNPLLPFHAEADRFWTLSSWDRTQIPKVGARIAMVFGEPFVVSPDADAAEIDEASRRLERSIAACEARCHEIVASWRSGRRNQSAPALGETLAPNTASADGTGHLRSQITDGPGTNEIAAGVADESPRLATSTATSGMTRRQERRCSPRR